MTNGIRRHIMVLRNTLDLLESELTPVSPPPAPSQPAPPRWLRWPSTAKPARLNSPFGHERPTFTHEGIDIFAPNGTEIIACADGIINKCYLGPFYGKCVVILHDRPEADYLTYYAHLQEWRVSPGQPVKQGELIGLADNTGNSTAAHLHLTLVQIGNRTKLRGISLIGCIDPMPHMIDPP